MSRREIVERSLVGLSAVVCLLLAVVLYAASRTVGRDMARLRAWQASRPAHGQTK